MAYVFFDMPAIHALSGVRSSCRGAYGSGAGDVRGKAEHGRHRHGHRLPVRLGWLPVGADNRTAAENYQGRRSSVPPGVRNLVLGSALIRAFQVGSLS